ncbi:non-structural maintenance of chromosomes element 1 homolog [Copidosoma floridanum]|uniref:non-structural maintenance of chromosomes element 1 homolog n=1 Tax=Copidosoma floridanum TaxID=29053 RepID=UPI0006C95F97|nr:non-structural maintenance of chromosomes element 1 homolog [Copidosoma floridanum]
MVQDYDDRHRTFLQAIMQGGAVSGEDATVLCYRIFNERISVERVAGLINDKLSPIAMAMKAGTCELTGQTYWSVVGTTHEDAVMLPSEFSKAERAFLRAVYSEIINSEDGYISSTECLNLTGTLDMKFSLSEADKFLKKVAAHKWLHLKDGSVFIGVRSIVEMMPYFRATYADNFHNCRLCKEVLFAGQKCPNCEEMYHNYCVAKYTAMQKTNQCPNCKQPWDDYDVSDVVLNSENNSQEDEDEAMDVAEEIKPSQPIRSSCKSKKRQRNE